jgi:DNA-binding MarR family transcriptional regulator
MSNLITEPSANEIELASSIERLKYALRRTLEYAQSDLVDQLPSNIAEFWDLAREPSPIDTSGFDHPADFARLISEMARFLSAASALGAFNEQVGLAQWTVLAALKEEPGLTERQLCKQIGATGERMRGIVAGLEEAKLVFAEPAKRPNTVLLSLSSNGEARLSEINETLLPVLEKFLKKRGPLTLRNAHRGIGGLSRMTVIAPGEEDV